MNCFTVEQKYKINSLIPSDINEHLETIRSYVDKCEFVIEFGVRGIVSTWAMLAGKPKRMISYDIENPSKWGGDINEVYNAARECDIDYQFHIGDTTKIEIEECDLLFIDTLHRYEQMKKELEIHGNKAKKYLLFHDTTSFRTDGEGGGIGIYPAIMEFLQQNKHWIIEKEFTNNNGFLILKRI